MNTYRQNLPQKDGSLFLTDAGLETDMIFNLGHDLPAFAAHTLLDTERGTSDLTAYFERFLNLAAELKTGFVLDVPLWRAQRYFAEEIGVSVEELKAATYKAVNYVSSLRCQFSQNQKPIVLNAVIGPRGDAYAPEEWIEADAAEAYHREQIGWLKDTEIDMVSALTLTHTEEAIGIVRAARAAELPVVICFTVETDGRLPSGQRLHDAISQTDAATGSTPEYYMINCAHPTHFAPILDHPVLKDRVRGLRCNASKLSHAELDVCEVLDEGDPEALALDYATLLKTLPNANVLGGCCGTDYRHISAIARKLRAPA